MPDTGAHRTRELARRTSSRGAAYRDGEARLPARTLDQRQRQLTRLGNAAWAPGSRCSCRGDRRAGGRVAPLARPSATARAGRRAAGLLGPADRRDEGALLAGDGRGAEEARWALDAGAADAESPIGRYAATLALLVLGARRARRAVAPTRAASATTSRRRRRRARRIAAADVVGYATAIEAVLDSFETREEFLEDVPVADTVLVLQALAAPRGSRPKLPASPRLALSRGRPSSARCSTVVTALGARRNSSSAASQLASASSSYLARVPVFLRDPAPSPEPSGTCRSCRCSAQFLALRPRRASRPAGRSLRPEAQQARRDAHVSVRLRGTASRGLDRRRRARSAPRGAASARGSAGARDRRRGGRELAVRSSARVAARASPARAGAAGARAPSAAPAGRCAGRPDADFGLAAMAAVYTGYALLSRRLRSAQPRRRATTRVLPSPRGPGSRVSRARLAPERARDRVGLGRAGDEEEHLRRRDSTGSVSVTRSTNGSSSGLGRRSRAARARRAAAGPGRARRRARPGPSPSRTQVEPRRSPSSSSYSRRRLVGAELAADPVHLARRRARAGRAASRAPAGSSSARRRAARSARRPTRARRALQSGSSVGGELVRPLRASSRR